MSEVIRELGEQLQATKHSNGGSYNQATDSICLAILAEDVLSRLPDAPKTDEEIEAENEAKVAKNPTPPAEMEPEKKPAPKKAARSGAKKK